MSRAKDLRMKSCGPKAGVLPRSSLLACERFIRPLCRGADWGEDSWFQRGLRSGASIERSGRSPVSYLVHSSRRRRNRFTPGRIDAFDRASPREPNGKAREPDNGRSATGTALSDSRALYHRGGPNAGGSNWVDGTALHGIRQTQTDENPRLAKVRVAGSNPVSGSYSSTR